MMRPSLFVVALLLVGCTRPNPAFDSGSDGGSEDGESSDEIGDDTEVEGESGEVDSGESGDADLPITTCDYQPSAGLVLGFGDPNHFGGMCPNGADLWARVVEAGGSTAIVETCTMAGCDGCGGEQPLAVFPLNLGDHLPVEPLTCLKLQANVPLGPVDGVCQWGALSLYGGIDGTPYIIAIARASEPTPLGTATLDGLIPEPVKVADCSCDDVGQSNDCCYLATTPPEFWGYMFGGELVLPGGNVMITLANQPRADYYFRLFQAERLNACESPERALSWAVTAKLP